MSPIGPSIHWLNMNLFLHRAIPVNESKHNAECVIVVLSHGTVKVRQLTNVCSDNHAWSKHHSEKSLIMFFSL